MVPKRFVPGRIDLGRILGIVLVAAFLQPAGAGAEDPQPAGTADPACSLPAVTGTFYQPLARHAQWPEQRWTDLSAALAEFGMREIFVQWTMADGIAFFPTAILAQAADSPLDRMFDLAARQHIGVWAGLELDKGFSPALQASAAALDAHLREQEGRLAAILPDLGAYLRRREASAGWYITAEIHDGDWIEGPRAQALQGHLARVTAMLKAERAMPVAISAFANGDTPPERFAAFWRGMSDAAGIDLLLFQDGVGAQKLSPLAAGRYARALAEVMRGAGREFGVIVEQFQPAGDGAMPARFVAAPLSRIVRQLDAVADLSGIRRIAFTLSDYILPEAGEPLLLEEYRRARPACD